MTDNGFRDRRIRPLCHPSTGSARALRSGEGGIRTLEGGIYPPNALAGRRLQPLGHFSVPGNGTKVLPAPNKGRSPLRWGREPHSRNGHSPDAGGYVRGAGTPDDGPGRGRCLPLKGGFAQRLSSRSSRASMRWISISWPPRAPSLFPSHGKEASRERLRIRNERASKPRSGCRLLLAAEETGDGRVALAGARADLVDRALLRVLVRPEAQESRVVA